MVVRNRRNLTSVSTDRTAHTNPFVPGFGSTPPALVGREAEFADIEAMIGRVRQGIYEQPRLLVGERGLGKTALLIEVTVWARRQRLWQVDLQAAETGDLTPHLMRDLREHLLAHDRDARVVDLVRRALRVLSSFSVTYGVGVKLDLTKESGRADTGDLATDLGDVLIATCQAARSVGTALLVTVDEVQKMPGPQLEALLTAVQRVYKDRSDPRANLPFALIAAGLPDALDTIRHLGGTFGERVRVHELDMLSVPETIEALVIPARERSVRWDGDALDRLALRTGGWPVAVQQYGYDAWNAGTGSLIASTEVERALITAERALDRIYAGRLRDTTDRQRAYLQAMAGLPAAERTSAAVAKRLGSTSRAWGSTRDGLIRSGLIRPDGYGRAAFTLPGFEDFLHRS